MKKDLLRQKLLIILNLVQLLASDVSYQNCKADYVWRQANWIVHNLVFSSDNLFIY
jgi:hypothetical protein